MKKRIALLLTVASLQTAYTQTVIDALQHSYTSYNGSARFEGLAGAMGAVGVDGSSALINPAGLGRLSRSKFSFSLKQNNIASASTFQGNGLKNTSREFKPSSVNLIFVSDVSKNNRGYLYHQFGFSYNRQDSYNNTIKYSGQMFNSLLDGFSNAANGYQSSELASYFPFTTSLAWETYAIDQLPNGNYIPRLTNGDQMHTRTIETIGGQNDYSFSYSNNFLNKVYFGMSYSLKQLRFDQKTKHQEVLLDNVGVSLNSFEYNYNLNTKGSSSTLKLGAIFLPVEQLRIGLSYHTKSWYKLNDTWTANMIAYHKDAVYGNDGISPPLGRATYRYHSPAKTNLSIAYFFGTKGFINLDAEYINYAKNKYKEDNFDVSNSTYYKNLTAQVSSQLRSVINLRVGAEYNLTSNYVLRAGYAFYDSPYLSQFNEITKPLQVISVGGGIKWKNSSVDLAIKHQNMTSNYYAFTESRTSVVQTKLGVSLSYSVSF